MVSMEITLEVPDDVGRALDTPEFRRTMLEGMAIEGYRAKQISEAQVRRMLGFESRFDVHAFFKARGVHMPYTFEEIERDTAVSEKLSGCLSGGQ